MADTWSWAWATAHAATGIQHYLPSHVARRHQAVVIAALGEEIVVAVPDPEEPEVGDDLELAARRPVRLVSAPPSVIEVALARVGRGGEYEAALLEYVRLLVRHLGLGHLFDDRGHDVLSGAVHHPEGVEFLFSRLPDAFASELRGLALGFPELSLPADQIPGDLRFLLPPGMREGVVAEQFAPLWVEGRTVVLGCSGHVREEHLNEIEAWSGYQVRAVLVPRAAIRVFLESHREADAARPPLLPPAVRGRVRRPPVVDRGTMLALARQMQVSLDDVVDRLQPEEPDHEDEMQLEPESAALRLVPRALLLSLQCVPLQASQLRMDLAIGTDRTDAREVADLLTALTGRVVHLRWYDPEVVRRGLRGASWSGPEWTAEPAQVRLPSFSGVEPHQVRAARAGAPSIHLDHYSVLPPGSTPLDGDHLRALQAIPLWQEGRVLMVAVADLSDSVLAELADAAGMTIWPVLAEAEAVARRLDVLARTAGQVDHIGTRDHPVLEYLQSSGRLTKTDLFRVEASSDGGLDIALERTGAMSAANFAEVAARLAGTEVVDLALQPREEEFYDPLGRLSRREVWDDPVDETAGRLVPAETAAGAGVLPFRRGRNRLMVAVVDPFDPRSVAVVESLRAHNPIVVVALRSQLTTAVARANGNMPLGEHLVARGVITPADLARALHLHRTASIRLGQALLNLGLVSEEQLAFFLAEQQELPYFRLEGMEPDSATSRLLPEELERSAGLVPLYQAGNHLAVATVDPLNVRALQEVEARTGLTVDPVVCTESDLQAMLEILYRADYLQRSVGDLVSRNPEESASRVLTQRQIVSVAVATLLYLAYFVYSPTDAATVLTATCSVFYAAFSLYKCYLIYRALSHDLEVPISADELAALADADLPVYTILVPLYREASVLPTLLHGLTRLNYPSAKLDVKLLLEEDDYETRDAIRDMNLPAYVEPVVVPAAHPRNKPKACNYGLIHARGELVVIYDAEDVPDPDQLRMAVAAFRKVGDEVTCVQAKLNYYNAHQNLLTHWFTIEYSMWFDLFLPGLDATSAPIPLGGTSNHFPTQRLRDVGAWDPFNVTEDADLGLRLFRKGGRTAIIDSTTLEEANSEVYNWIRQRSRWVKGYIQTYLVHMRHPRKLWQTIGPKAFFEFQLVIGGTFFSFLINPIFWGLTALWYLAHAGFIRDIYPAPVYYLGILSLVLGNFAFIYLNVAGCLRRKNYAMVRYSLLVPLYWALMSVAAWKGFLQLAYKPFYWEKTVHGLYKPEGQDAVAGIGD